MLEPGSVPETERNLCQDVQEEGSQGFALTGLIALGSARRIRSKISVGWVLPLTLLTHVREPKVTQGEQIFYGKPVVGKNNIRVYVARLLNNNVTATFSMLMNVKEKVFSITR